MSRTPNYSVTGAWLEGDDPGERKFLKIGYLLLENGETLPDITIAYQSWGTLNKDKSNAILINHAMTGWSDVTVGAQNIDDLPAAARDYITRIEELIGAPVDVVSTGPDRVETIVLRHAFDA